MSNRIANDIRRDDPFVANPNLRGFEYTMIVIRIVLCITSFFGNVMIVAMMSRKKNRGQQSSIMFSALAISDTLVTVFGPLRNLLSVGLGVNYFSWTMADQKLITLATSSVIQISSSLLVLITIERVVCVAIPHKVSTILTVRVVTAFVVVIYLFFPLFNSFFIFSQTVEKSVEERGLKVTSHTDELYSAAYRWSEFLFKFCIPIAIILPSNVFIIYKVILSEAVSTNGINRRTRTVTKNVVIVCVVFIVALSPRQVYNSIRLLKISERTENMITYFMLSTIFEYLENCNASINFYVYILSGTKFRQELLELISCLLPLCLRRIIIGNGS